ncbi:MAG: urease accessory protein UreD [Pseudomonadota bacterium]
MLDARSDMPRLQRMQGRATVRLARGRLIDLAQQGAAKAMLPRIHTPGVQPVPEVVFLNTAGGVTGGDHLETTLGIEDGHLVGTTQTAERAYRARDGVANVSVHLQAGAGATLAWLPQETILYDGAALHRQTTAELSAGAELILADSFVLGRIAMGEQVRRLTLRDRRDILVDGRPVVIDPLMLHSADLTRPGAAGLGEARALATVHLIAPTAGDRLDRLRAILPSDGSAAASAWDGRLSMRVMHRDPAVLRATLARALIGLTGRPLPRVWPQ